MVGATATSAGGGVCSTGGAVTTATSTGAWAVTSDVVGVVGGEDGASARTFVAVSRTGAGASGAGVSAIATVTSAGRNGSAAAGVSTATASAIAACARLELPLTIPPVCAERFTLPSPIGLAIRTSATSETGAAAGSAGVSADGASATGAAPMTAAPPEGALGVPSTDSRPGAEAEIIPISPGETKREARPSREATCTSPSVTCTDAPAGVTVTLKVVPFTTAAR